MTAISPAVFVSIRAATIDIAAWVGSDCVVELTRRLKNRLPGVDMAHQKFIFELSN